MKKIRDKRLLKINDRILNDMENSIDNKDKWKIHLYFENKDKTLNWEVKYQKIWESYIKKYKDDKLVKFASMFENYIKENFTNIQGLNYVEEIRNDFKDKSLIEDISNSQIEILIKYNNTIYSFVLTIFVDSSSLIYDVSGMAISWNKDSYFAIVKSNKNKKNLTEDEFSMEIIIEFFKGYKNILEKNILFL